MMIVKKSQIRKALMIFVAFTLMAIPMLAFAASYSTSFELAYHLEGPSRSYSKGNLNITTSNVASTGTTSSLIVTVHKGSTVIGQKSYPSTTGVSKDFTLPSAGSYSVWIDKADDYVTVKGFMDMTQ